VLELKDQPSGGPALDQIRATFDKLEEQLEKKGVSEPEKWNRT